MQTSLAIGQYIGQNIFYLYLHTGRLPQDNLVLKLVYITRYVCYVTHSCVPAYCSFPLIWLFMSGFYKTMEGKFLQKLNGETEFKPLIKMKFLCHDRN